MILFLDFDGVLHSDDVYLDAGKPELRGEGHLMMHVPILEKILEAQPHVKIVLSTSWAQKLGVEVCKEYLPQAIAERVIGSTLDGMPGLVKAFPRCLQIEAYAVRHDVTKWVAIDDLFAGQQVWVDDLIDHFVLTEADKGLSCGKVQERLIRLLSDV